MEDKQLQLALYVNKASELAEAVRYNIQHNNSVITPETIVILNAFIIAANQIKDLTDVVQNGQIQLN